jgi:hypothetical protein
MAASLTNPRTAPIRRSTPFNSAQSPAPAIAVGNAAASPAPTKLSGVNSDEQSGEVVLFVTEELNPMRATAPDGTPIVFLIATLEPQ